MPIDARHQARQLRDHLAEIDRLCHDRPRGLTKADTERARQHVNAARAHLTSLEIATGLRPIGAALADPRG